MPNEENMLTKKRFTAIVEDLVHIRKMSYLDAITFFCEENFIEIEDITKYISPVIKNKLEAEAMKLNLLPRESQLPI